VTSPAARRRDAALAGHRGDASTARRALTDEDPNVRATALRALARADALTVDMLTTAVDDGDPVVRRAVAELVGDSSDPALDTPLLSLLSDTRDDVVEVAAWAAGERERATTPIIDKLIELTTTHADPLVREAAVAALGAIGNERALRAILDATRDKATVRRRAVLALAPFDGPEVDAALERALSDRDWQVRQAAEDLTD
jgi:HEAT repeat protein